MFTSASTLTRSAEELKALKGIDQLLYAIKANPHPEILAGFAEQGLGFECVSRGEVERVLEAVPAIDRKRILYTPNFAPRDEYAWALESGAWVTLDNLHPLRHWGELFRGRDLLVRIDTGYGRGHHDHVRTAGVHSKFGVPLFELDELERRVDVARRTHRGSSCPHRQRRVRRPQLAGSRPAAGRPCFAIHRRAHRQSWRWARRARKAGPGASRSRGVADRHRRAARRWPRLELWLEPGRYLVAQAGVLVAQVTQLKGKGAVQYVGVATGMNSLIRPALVRRAPRHREPHAAGRARYRGLQRGRTDLRIGGLLRPRAPAAADGGG